MRLRENGRSMYSVLLPVGTNVDRGLKAAEYVQNLPESATEVEVFVVHIFEEFSLTDGEGGLVRSEELFNEESVPESVTEVTKFLEDNNIKTTVRHIHGDPAETIIETADELAVDEIAICGRKRSPTGKAVFGSMTQSVLLSSDRPVTVLIQQ